MQASLFSLSVCLCLPQYYYSYYRTLRAIKQQPKQVCPPKKKTPSTHTVGSKQARKKRGRTACRNRMPSVRLLSGAVPPETAGFMKGEEGRRKLLHGKARRKERETQKVSKERRVARKTSRLSSAANSWLSQRTIEEVEKQNLWLSVIRPFPAYESEKHVRKSAQDRMFHSYCSGDNQGHE
ncbi:hypothetical protein IWZ00DRAFT_300631 [Phyllosticta capitalensis]